MNLPGATGVVVLELDAAGREIHRAIFPGDYVRLIRRSKDRRLLQAFFGDPDRRTWDLAMMAKEAEAVAKTTRARGGRGHGQVRDRRGTPGEFL